LEYSHGFLILFLIIIVSFVVFWEIPEFRFMLTGRVAIPSVGGTTANVTIYGKLGNITVYFNPVNFTSSDVGEAPGATYPKVNAGGVGYIRVNLTVDNNMEWDMYMNASDLTDGAGHTIPVGSISVNSSCDGQKSTPVSLISLSNDLKSICGDQDGDNSDIDAHNYADIEFYLFIPAGQYNATYNGHIWIYVNHTGTEPTGDNRTWYGPYNITVKVKQFIEISWSLVPISFGSLSPDTKSNATCGTGGEGCGWPANLTNSANTNVFIDLYVNGTHLVNPANDIIGVGNISYSNASLVDNWPDSIIDLSLSFPAQGTTFDNWQHVRNDTDILSRWNISIPIAQPGGVYNGSVNAKAVEEGETA